MESPCLGGKQLAFRLEAGVGGPELSAEQQTTVGFGATGVDFAGYGVGGA